MILSRGYGHVLDGKASVSKNFVLRKIKHLIPKRNNDSFLRLQTRFLVPALIKQRLLIFIFK